jgi:hypothetical protein
VLADDKVISWGKGPGIGHQSENVMFPIVVEGLGKEKTIQIAATASCSTALTESGRFYIWGKFGHYSNSTPTSLLGEIEPSKIVCSACKIFVIDSIGDVYQSDSGEPVCEIESKMLNRLWSPREDEASSPKVSGIPNVNADRNINFGIIENLEGKVIVDGAAGVSHVLLLTSNGEVYTFGSGIKGQLVIV